MATLSKEAERYMEKILKHYPMPDPSEKENAAWKEHKYPQQHMHDYRKVWKLLGRNDRSMIGVLRRS
jgi:hypothetical protein